MQFKTHKYLITMYDYDDFIISIKQDTNRPNNPTDDDLIKEYMNNNYFGHSYNAIDLDYLEYFKTVEL